MRGRKPDTAAMQDAKGNPGKRQRARKAKPASADQRAAQLASAPADLNATAGKLAAPISHPKFLAEPKMKEALAIWKELAPELVRLHLLDRLDRYSFALYCVHLADWIVATRDIQQRKQWMNVKNVNGDMMPRLNPSVKVRELAERHILEIGARFGLDPANRYRLMRDQAAAPLPQGNAGDQPGLPLEGEPGAGNRDASSIDDGAPPNPLGLMNDIASRPPGARVQ